MIREDIVGNKIKTLRSPFLSLLIPSDKEYMTDTVLECESFDLINPNITKNLSKKVWEEYIFYWYRSNLLKSITLEHSTFEEENINFYSAKHLINETDFKLFFVHWNSYNKKLVEITSRFFYINLRLYLSLLYENTLANLL